MKLEITYLSVDDLTPYEHNTRSHGEEDVNKIAKSIENMVLMIPSEYGVKRTLLLKATAV